jgi:acyl transferase domain-containing protein
MGKQLLDEEPIFRKTIEECDGLIRKHTGWSLITELLAGESQSRLSQTEIAQPAIFAIQAGLVACFRAWGIVPDAVIGHSVGEIASAYTASVISLDDAIRIAIHRAKLMQRVQGKGRMAAVGISYEEAERLVSVYSSELSVAAINGPASTVLAGDGASITLFTRHRWKLSCRNSQNT